MGMIAFFLILFLGYQLLTCHWGIQQLWLPMISDLTGYRLSASKVDFSLNLRKNAVQIRVHDLNWNNDTETMAGNCEYLSGRFYLHDLLYRKIVFLDQIDIQNARMVMYSSGRKKPVRKTDQGALRLGRISVQHFVFQHEIAQDLYYTVTMQKLDASGLQPDKKDNLTAQFEFQPASFAEPVKKIQLKASAEYFLDQDFKLDDLAVMLQGNCFLDQPEKEPIGFSAYIE